MKMLLESSLYLYSYKVSSEKLLKKVVKKIAPSYPQLVYFYLIKQWIQKKMEEKLGGRGVRFLPP